MRSRPPFEPVPVRFPAFVSILFVTLVFAGCVGGNSQSVGGPDVSFDKGDVVIRGIVVDEELVPLEGVVIHDAASLLSVETDTTGQFALGPVTEGEHALTASKDGYQPLSLTVQVFDESVEGVRFLLSAVATTVPYHETTNHVTFVNCASYNPIGGVPCTELIDYVVGGNQVSPQESFAFRFKIPNAGLADLLIEMVWAPQAFGPDAAFWIQTPPGQPVTAASVKYFSMRGGNPLRGWVTANVANQNYESVFDAEPNKIEYDAVTAWSDGNATIPRQQTPVTGISGVSIYINHRVETWMTFFYNREGTRDYTALPDQ